MVVAVRDGTNGSGRTSILAGTAETGYRIRVQPWLH
jgi:hypothetical protein